MRGERRTTGALVWHLALRWRAAVDRAVAPLGLTHAQYSVVASLRGLTRSGESPSQSRLAEYTGLGPIYVSKLIRSLEHQGVVHRTPDPGDARAVQLTLTDQGTQVVDRAIRVVRDLNRQLTAVLGGPDSDEVRSLEHALETLLRAAPPLDATTATDTENPGEDPP